MMELSAMKDTLDFTNLLTALIHTQIQHLVDQLSEFTDSQTIWLSASPSKLPRILGSTKGLAFLHQNHIGTQFVEFLKEETRQGDSANGNPDNMKHDSNFNITDTINNAENASKKTVKENKAQKCHTPDKIIKNSNPKTEADPIQEIHESSVLNESSKSCSVNKAINTLKLKLKLKWADSSHNEDRVPNISPQECDKLITTPTSIQGSESIRDQISKNPCKETFKASTEVCSEDQNSIETPTLKISSAETVTNKLSPENVSNKYIDNEEVDQEQADVDEDYFSAINTDNNSDISAENDEDCLDGENEDICVTPKQKVVTPVSDKAINQSKVSSKTHTQAELTCKVCGKEFTNNKYVREHMVVHTGEKPFRCTVCNEAFKWRSVLRKHKWKCGHGVGFRKGKRSYQYYNVTYDQDGAKGNDTVDEPRCKQPRINSEEDLTIKNLTETPKTKCKQTVNQHEHKQVTLWQLKKYLTPEHMTCKWCKKVLRTLKELKEHENIHTKQFQCFKCDLIIDDREMFRDHLRKCNIVPDFIRKLVPAGTEILMENKKRDGEKKVLGTKSKVSKFGNTLLKQQFLCKKCNHSFLLKSTLQNHTCKFLNKVHKKAAGSEQEVASIIPNKDKQPNKTSKVKYIKCQKCLKSFQYRFLLKKHICKPRYSTSITSKLLSNSNKTNLKDQPSTTEVTPKASSTNITKRNVKYKPVKLPENFNSGSWSISPDINTNEKLELIKQWKSTACPACGKPYSQYDKSREHYIAFHLQLKPFTCNKCQGKFTRVSALHKHTKTCRGILDKQKAKAGHNDMIDNDNVEAGNEDDAIDGANHTSCNIFSMDTDDDSNDEGADFENETYYNNEKFDTMDQEQQEPDVGTSIKCKSPRKPGDFNGGLVTQSQPPLNDCANHKKPTILDMNTDDDSNSEDDDFEKEVNNMDVIGTIDQGLPDVGTSKKYKSPRKTGCFNDGLVNQSQPPLNDCANPTCPTILEMNTDDDSNYEDDDYEKEEFGTIDQGLPDVGTSKRYTSHIKPGCFDDGFVTQSQPPLNESANHTSPTILEMNTDDDRNSEDDDFEKEVNNMDVIGTIDRGLPDVGTSKKCKSHRKPGCFDDGLVTQSQPPLNDGENHTSPTIVYLDTDGDINSDDDDFEKEVNNMDVIGTIDKGSQM